MRVAIHQPLYLPWIGFFHKMAHCDLLVVLDIVQYHDRLYQRRNRIKTAQGWIWLSVPVKGSRRQLVKNAVIDEDLLWRNKHWRSIALNYAGATFAKNYLPGMEEIYRNKWELLVDLDLAIIRLWADYMGISTPMIRASRLGVAGNRTELIVNIARKVGADTYLSGISGKKYLREELFAAKDISVEYQKFQHPVYPQRFGSFEPCMAAIDLLCNCGLDGARLVTEGPAD